MKKIILGTSLLISSLTFAESLRIEIGENTKDVSVPSYVLKCKNVKGVKALLRTDPPLNKSNTTSFLGLIVVVTDQLSPLLNFQQYKHVKCDLGFKGVGRCAAAP